MSQIGKYFKSKEFACPCCQKTAPSRRLVGILDAARAQLGPLRINSGYRCPKHNQEVGGKKQSLHLPIGGIVYAADVTYSDVGKRHGEHILKLYVTLEGIARRYEGMGYGLGLYSNFVHFDTRGEVNKPMARWDKYPWPR
tara:strand:- start:267 stop:686 length:420 start_codon:yes stop_codon:yes gene_type:complete